MNNEKTAAQITQERINALPAHSEYKYDPTLPICLGRSVLLKKIAIKERKTAAGILLVDNGRVKNSNVEANQDRKEGIICGVGPDCSAYLKVGCRAVINVNSGDAGFIHTDDHFYYKCHEMDVYYILPDEETVTDNGVKTDSMVRREKGHERQERQALNDSIQDGNDEDRWNDRTRGKTTPLPGMKED